MTAGNQKAANTIDWFPGEGYSEVLSRTMEALLERTEQYPRSAKRAP